MSGIVFKDPSSTGRRTQLRKGTMHVRTAFSHGDTLTVAELVSWCTSRICKCLALGNRSRDMDEAKITVMNGESTRISKNVIPRLRYSCRGPTHPFSTGAVTRLPDLIPVMVVAQARTLREHAVLADASRIMWKCLLELLRAADQAGSYNAAYDEKCHRSFRASAESRQMRQTNPKIAVTADRNSYRREGFYCPAPHADATSVLTNAIPAETRQGNCEIRRPFSHADSHRRFILLKSGSLSALSRQPASARSARVYSRRWAS
jgi:hypothetical protein